MEGFKISANYMNKDRAVELWARIQCKLDQKADQTQLNNYITWQRNPNLLINWHFITAVNQREKIRYEDPLGYTIDMWKLHKKGGSYDVSSHIMRFEPFEWSGIVTITEWNAEYPAQPVTASILYSSKVDTKILLYYEGIKGPNSNHVIVPAHEMAVYSITATVPQGTTGIEVQLNRVRGEETEGEALIVAAKLERGNIQTLAHKNDNAWILNDPPPERGLELLKCQRYQVVYGGEGGMPLLAPGYSTGTVTAVFLLDLPTAMRATPAVSFSNLYVNLSGTRIPVTGAAVLGAPAQNKLAMQVTCSGANFGAGEPCFLEGQGDYRLLLDANL